MGYHALVFGASGILGWAVVNEILNNYPAKGTYSKVTALTNRPLTVNDAYWPKPGPDTPELSLISGIDLTQGTVDGWKETLKQKIPDIETVDHVYYFAYKFHPDFQTESEINLGMMKRGFGAVDALVPNISYVILPTGTKGYGILLQPRPFEAPFVESMGEIPRPARDALFYFVLRDELNRMQQGKSWKWAEVRCDIVPGFVPHSNPYNLAGGLMNFLSLYKFMHEQGHPDAVSNKVPYPSSASSYHSLNNDGGQDIFARFSIHLCLNPDRAGTGELYNIADEEKATTYAERWPFACSLFGLEGVGPVDPSSLEHRNPAQFVRDHHDQVEKLAKEKGVQLQVIHFDMPLEYFDFDHHVLLDKARRTGFTESESFRKVWKTVFERYARVGKAYLGESRGPKTAVV